jgi:hypothetical protein
MVVQFPIYTPLYIPKKGYWVPFVYFLSPQQAWVAIEAVAGIHSWLLFCLYFFNFPFVNYPFLLFDFTSSMIPTIEVGWWEQV